MSCTEKMCKDKQDVPTSTTIFKIMCFNVADVALVSYNLGSSSFSKALRITGTEETFEAFAVHSAAVSGRERNVKHLHIIYVIVIYTSLKKYPNAHIPL